MINVSAVLGLLPLIGALFAFVGAYFAVMSLKHRLRIERKLAHNLAKSLKNRGIESKVLVDLSKITIRGRCAEDEVENFKREVDDALQEALRNLFESERKLVMSSLEQPSKQGQLHYLRKVVSNSLDELSHV